MFSSVTRYILRLLLVPTILITFSLTAIVWLLQSLRFVDFIINRGLSVGDFLYLTLLILPSLLTIILPVALPIAVVFIYHKLTAESELLVMQAAGMSRWQLTRPALLAALLIAGLTYGFTLYILPAANRQFKDMREFLKDNYASILLQEEVFNHPVDGMTVFIRERDEFGELSGILVHDNRDPAQIVTMMAEKGTLVQTAQGPRFGLRNGVRQERRDGRVSWLNFDSYTLDLSFYTKKTLKRVRDPSERDVVDLWHSGGTSAQRMQARAEAHRRVSWPVFAIILSLLSVGMVTSGQFNRRGMWKKLVATACVIITIVIGYFALGNLLNTQPLALWGLYGYIVALLAGAAWLLHGVKFNTTKFLT